MQKLVIRLNDFILLLRNPDWYCMLDDFDPNYFCVEETNEWLEYWNESLQGLTFTKLKYYRQPLRRLPLIFQYLLSALWRVWSVTQFWTRRKDHPRPNIAFFTLTKSFVKVICLNHQISEEQ